MENQAREQNLRGEYREDEEFRDLVLENASASDCEFVACQFINCSFTRCSLRRCVFSECSFVNCYVAELEIQYTDVKFAELKDCTFLGVNWSLMNADSSIGTVISKIENCRLTYNTFSEMSFRRFHFSGSTINKSSYMDCMISEADFRGCDLTETEFFRCDLKKADFRNAVGYKIDIQTCPMKDARFSYPEVANLLYSLNIRIE